MLYSNRFLRPYILCRKIGHSGANRTHTGYCEVVQLDGCAVARHNRGTEGIDHTLNHHIAYGNRGAVMVENGQVLVGGIPFSGSSGISENVSLPLAAIVYLSQAPQTRITRLSGVRAFRSIWEGCSISVWDRQDVDLCTHSVSAAVCAVPVFHLACTPDESAVIALESALEQWR